MYYKLNKSLCLRGWQKAPYALVDRSKNYTHFISAAEMHSLEMCNGKIDLSLGIVPGFIKEMLPILEQNGIIVPCEAGDGILPEQEYYCYPSRYIRTAHWSVTGRCNYRCKHCYMSAPDAKLGELSHHEIMSIARELVECGIGSVSLTGGEPLIRKDFMDIADTLIKGGVRITTIYSNGKLVTDKLLDDLKLRGITPEFNMSYDGVDGWHDWLRGVDGATKDVEDAFIRCREKGFPTGAEMCIHNGNKHLLRETVNRLASLGCSSLKVIPVSDVGAWKENGFGESIGIDELYRVYYDYLPYYYEDGMPLSLMLGGFFSASKKSSGEYTIPLMKSCTNPRAVCVCGHARMVMYISPEGRTLPCMSLSGSEIQNKFPSIVDSGLKECLSDSYYMNFLETRASEVLKHNSQCESCEYAMKCLGGCRASALETSPGDLMAPDRAACTLFKGGWADKIIERMNKMGKKLN